MTFPHDWLISCKILMATAHHYRKPVAKIVVSDSKRKLLFFLRGFNILVYVSYVPALYGVYFLWNLVYRWVGFRHWPNAPNLQNLVYFGRFCQKSTQFGLNWVFFCRKWYIEGCKKIVLFRYSERWIFGVRQAHPRTKFGREPLLCPPIGQYTECC